MARKQLTHTARYQAATKQTFPYLELLSHTASSIALDFSVGPPPAFATTGHCSCGRSPGSNPIKECVKYANISRTPQLSITSLPHAIKQITNVSHVHALIPWLVLSDVLTPRKPSNPGTHPHKHQERKTLRILLEVITRQNAVWGTSGYGHVKFGG